MINDVKTLNEYIMKEREIYSTIGYKGKFHSFITQCEIGKIVEYMVVLRKDEYYTNLSNKSIVKKMLMIYYRRKHNKLSVNLGMSIPINTFGKGLLIYHSQGIIVHKDARCGEYCKLHGCNCIGNNGRESDKSNTPIIGDNVDFGVGAKVIGGIEVADGVVIAANAVVCKSVTNRDAVVVGVPAKEL